MLVLIAASILALANVACGSIPVAPLASANGPSLQDPRTVSVTGQDLPAGLIACPISGPIDRYLHQLQMEGSPSFEVTAAQWTSMKRIGATAAWVQSYTRTSDDCSARLGERRGPSAISFAIRFKDAATALNGFAAGFLGLRPEPGMQVPGLSQGLQTQLTSDAWTYDQSDQTPPVFVAYWANRQFDLFLLTESVPGQAAAQAASDMNSRVR